MPRTAKKPQRLEPLIAAAKYRKVDPRTLRRWGEQGRITLYRVGPKLLYVDLDELDNLARPVASAARGAA